MQWKNFQHNSTDQKGTASPKSLLAFSPQFIKDKGLKTDNLSSACQTHDV